MRDSRANRLSRAELEAEQGSALPAKEVVSLLDLNLDLDLALDLAAPIDLAVAANANVAAPIDAAVAANALSFGSTAGALADQDVLIDQHLSGEAIADASQHSTIDQGDDTVGEAPTDTVEPPEGSLLDGDLLNVNVDVNLDADLAAPIAGAVAANANVAAPIDAAVAANVGSVASEATAIADQDAIITQDLDGVVAHAIADQDSELTQ
jgi:hypothetical protein